MMRFNELPEFKKESRKLHKKYRYLLEDLQTFRDVIFAKPLGNSKHFAILTKTESVFIVKARLFCRNLKGSSLRIVYSWNKQEQRIEFIELYFMGDKATENNARIHAYLKTIPTKPQVRSVKDSNDTNHHEKPPTRDRKLNSALI